jgi:PAS domain S-box-containing protein
MDLHPKNNVIDNQITYLKQLDILSNRLTLDHKKNIDIVVAFANEILGGVCSLYNKLDKRDNSLVCWSKENTPPDLPDKDVAKGHICYEATIKGKDKIINLPDISTTPYQESDPYVKKYGLKSYLGFPVKINNQSLGSLCIVDTNIRQFSDLEIALITHLANVIRIQEENLKINNIQTVLYKISRTLITSNNLKELCLQIKDNLSTIIDSSNFTVTLFNDEEEEIYQFNDDKEDKNCEEQYLLNEIKEKKQSLLFTKSQILTLLPSDLAKNCACVSWVGVPLKINNELIGVISLKSFQQAIYLDEDVKLLEFVSFEIAHILNEKRLRENLAQREEEFRSIVNQSAIGIYRTDFAGNILFVNDALVSMLEYDTEEELLCHDLTKTYHPDYERKYFIQSLIEKTVVTNAESLWTTKTGKKIFVRETAKLVKHQKNDGIIEGTVENITEEINARKAYKFEKEKFDGLLTTVPIGIIQVDRKNNILSVNEHFTKITGYKKEDLSNISQFFHMVFDESSNSAQIIQQNSSLKILYDKTGQKKYIKIFQTKTTDGTSIFSIEDITANILNKTELVEQSKYLFAINKISNKLLSGSIIPYDEILEIIGNTLKTSQITLYKYYKFDDRSEIQTMAQWGNAGEEYEQGDQLKQQFYTPRATFPNWTKKLSIQDFLCGTVDSFMSPEKEYMQNHKIKSIFVHNLNIDDEFWGFIVLKNHKEKYLWSDRDIILLKTIIHNLSDAISQKLMNSKLTNSKIKLYGTI